MFDQPYRTWCLFCFTTWPAQRHQRYQVVVCRYHRGRLACTMSIAKVESISRHSQCISAKAYLKFFVLVWLKTWWCWQVLHNVKSFVVPLTDESFRVMGRNRRHDRKNIQMRKRFLKERRSDLYGRRAVLLKSVLGGVRWRRRGTRAFFNGWEEKERGVGWCYLLVKISFSNQTPIPTLYPPESMTKWFDEGYATCCRQLNGVESETERVCLRWIIFSPFLSPDVSFTLDKVIFPIPTCNGRHLHTPPRCRSMSSQEYTLKAVDVSL